MIRPSKRCAIFRFDAGPEIGGGHALRCLALAETLMRSGWMCRYAIGPGSINAVQQLMPYEKYCFQLSGKPESEINEIEGYLKGRKCDLFVVDHYGRDIHFERLCRTFAKYIMVIDDMVNRSHDADYLLNQNLGSLASSYKTLVPGTCRFFIGPQYALLRPEFYLNRLKSLARRQHERAVQRILVSFGLSETCRFTERVVKALANTSYSGYIDVVGSGEEFRKSAVFSESKKTRPRIRILRDVDDIAVLMRDADLAIGAAGSMSWERCTLGLPSLVTAIADNQRTIAHALFKAGAADVFDFDMANEDDGLAKSLAKILIDRKRVKQMSTIAADICDGLGCERVTEALGL